MKGILLLCGSPAYFILEQIQNYYNFFIDFHLFSNQTRIFHNDLFKHKKYINFQVISHKMTTVSAPPKHSPLPITKNKIKINI